jgi:hypothetical protein
MIKGVRKRWTQIDIIFIFALSFSLIVLMIPSVLGGQCNDVDGALYEQVAFIERYKIFKSRRDTGGRVKVVSEISGRQSFDESDHKIKEQGILKKNLSGKDPRSGIETLIRRAAEVYNVPDAMIKAIIRTESDFNRDAISPQGAQGLMQLMPATASMIQVNDPFDPEQNVTGGTGLIRRYLDKYGSIKKCLIAYNAGPLYVERGVKIPSETANYIKNVFHHYIYYKKNR